MHMNAPGILKRHRLLILVLLIISVGFYLRFWHFERAIPFSWDQGRDAFAVRDLLNGKLPLRGPRTGVGDFYLGPAYYYLLAPFYLISNLDPDGANYFNMVVNVLTFIVIYWVTKRVFSKKIALLALFFYAFSRHAIASSMVPWNVSLVPGLVILILFCLFQLLNGKYKYLVAIASLAGFFFHIHFTAVFLPLIILPYLVLAFFRNKVEVFKWSLISLPFFLVWFVPTVVESLMNYNDNYYRFLTFLKTFAMGFHFQFMVYRLPDSLIQFAALLNNKAIESLKYVIPLVFAIVVIFREKKRDTQVFLLLLLMWFLVPLFGFTLFKGHVTDYYYLINFPIAIIIISYLIEKVINLKVLVINVLVFGLLAVYFFTNTSSFWNKPISGGLYKQKFDVLGLIDGGEKVPYLEGDMKSYLYTIWFFDKKPKPPIFH